MIRRAAFTINRVKETAVQAAMTCAALCREQGILPLVLVEDREEWERLAPDLPAGFIESPKKADALFVFGGDGTLLRALDKYAGMEIPILGVNLGRLGFLPEVQTGDMARALACLRAGDYREERRIMLSFRAETAHGAARGVATNEVAVSRGLSQRMIAMDVLSDGKLVEHYIADGILIASPTGSTAYSLAAGGPVVSPDVSCLLITPVCPHSLHARPFVVSDQSRIEIRLRMAERREGILLSADGEPVSELSNDDVVEITRSPHDARLIRLPGERDFFGLVKHKLSANPL
ncbi:MAG: NAD(+)/NADH kinase [Clostridiales bacterium]|nr:NAD(+)/NADH kinase [Clostridiales bacterium]